MRTLLPLLLLATLGQPALAESSGPTDPTGPRLEDDGSQLPSRGDAPLPPQQERGTSISPEDAQPDGRPDHPTHPDMPDEPEKAPLAPAR